MELGQDSDNLGIICNLITATTNKLKDRFKLKLQEKDR